MSRTFINVLNMIGSMMSAVKCSNCPSGYLLPLHPTLLGRSLHIGLEKILSIVSLGSPQCCQDCQKKVGAKMIEARINSAVKLIKEKRDGDNESLLCLAAQLEQDSLHANHYLIVGIKEIVIQRLMSSLRNHKSGKLILEEEELLEAYQLRSKLFEEVARVLVLVDSEGTDWMKKLKDIQNDIPAL